MILDIVISGLPGHIQTKRKGDLSFVLTISSGLYAFLNREILDRKLNWSNGYFGCILGNSKKTLKVGGFG